MNLRIEMIKTELILLCAPVLWGLGFSAAKSALSEVSPGWMNVFRAGIAVLVLLPFVIKYRDQWNRRTLLNGLLLGVLLFVNFTAQIIGLQYTSAGENAFLCSTYVVMTPFIVWIAKRVRPTGKEFLCAGIAIAGIALISLQGNMHFGIGQLITLGCPAAAAVIFVVTGHVAKEDNIYLLTWIQMLTVTVLSLLTASWFGAAPSHVSAGGIGAVLYMGVCYTGLAFICQNYGLAHASPEHTSIMLSLESVLGWMFGIILLHEAVTLRGAAGGILVFTAIMISVAGQRETGNAAEHLKSRALSEAEV